MKFNVILVAMLVRLVTIHLVKTTRINHSGRNLSDKSSNLGLLIGNILTNNSSGTQPDLVVPTRYHSTHSSLPFTNNSNITRKGTTTALNKTSVDKLLTNSPPGKQSYTFHAQHNNNESDNSTNSPSATYASFSSTIKSPSASSAALSSSMKSPSATLVPSVYDLEKSTLVSPHSTEPTVTGLDLTTNKDIYESSTENKRVPNSTIDSSTKKKLDFTKLHSITATTHAYDSTSNPNKENSKMTDIVIITSQNTKTDTPTKSSAESQPITTPSRTPETTIQITNPNFNQSEDKSTPPIATDITIQTMRPNFNQSKDKDTPSKSPETTVQFKSPHLNQSTFTDTPSRIPEATTQTKSSELSQSKDTTNSIATESSYSETEKGGETTKTVLQTMRSTANLVTNTINTSSTSDNSPIVYSKTTTHSPTTSTRKKDVDSLSNISQSDADRYWPVAMAIAIGVPSIIVIGVTISVINRKRNLEKAHSTLLSGYITPPTEYDV